MKSRSEPQTQPEHDDESQPQTQPQTQPKHDDDPQPQTQPKHDDEPQPQTQPKHDDEPQPEPEPEDGASSPRSDVEVELVLLELDDGNGKHSLYCMDSQTKELYEFKGDLETGEPGESVVGKMNSVLIKGNKHLFNTHNKVVYPILKEDAETGEVTKYGTGIGMVTKSGKLRLWKK